MPRILTTLIVAAAASCGPSQPDVAVIRQAMDDDAHYATSHRLTASDGDDGRAFGEAVATGGSRIAVGAPDRPFGGAVYIYEKAGGWAESQILESSVVDERFGKRVAMEGDVLAVQAASALYFYRADSSGSYARVDTFEHPAPEPDDGFGLAVALDATVAAVGAPHHQTDGTVWVVEATNPERTTWEPTAVLSVADRDFGRAVAVHGDRIAVGARKAGTGTSSQGLVFLFDRQPDGTWLETARIESESPTDFDEFGQAIDLGTDRFITGAATTGIALIYELQNGAWRETARIAPSSAVMRFASAVALDGELAATSSMFDANPVWVWRNDGTRWVEAGRSAPGSSPQGVSFAGSSLSFEQGTLVVAAPDPVARGIDGMPLYLEGWADVMEPNHPPSASTTNLVVDEDTDIDLLPALGALDAEGDSIDVEVVEGPSNGTISGAGGTTVYRSAQDYNGPDAATVVLVDARGARTQVEITIDVTAVNDAPRGSDVNAETPFGVPVTIELDATDPEGDDLHAIITSDTEHGSLTANGTVLNYVPDEGWEGYDFARFRLSDGTDQSTTLELSVQTLADDVEKPEPEVPDAGEGEPSGDGADEEDSPSTGCSAASGSPGSPAWPSLFLAAILLVAVRNRSL